MKAEKRKKDEEQIKENTCSLIPEQVHKKSRKLIKKKEDTLTSLRPVLAKIIEAFSKEEVYVYNSISMSEDDPSKPETIFVCIIPYDKSIKETLDSSHSSSFVSIQ
jgi:hypothetical protein